MFKLKRERRKPRATRGEHQIVIVVEVEINTKYKKGYKKYDRIVPRGHGVSMATRCNMIITYLQMCYE